MKALLAKNGYTVNVASPTPSGSPAPAKAPAATPAEPARLQP
jgi:hypothetical protein